MARYDWEHLNAPTRRKTRLVAATAALAGLFSLALTTPAHAAPTIGASQPVSGTTVAEAVSDALAAAWGPGMAVDASTTPVARDLCMGTAPQPLAYRTDRIVLRTSASDADAVREVRRALTDLGATAQVNTPERITFPLPESGEPITPVLNVPLMTNSAEDIPIVALARLLTSRGWPAGPDYALSPSGGPTLMWPNGGPRPIDQLTPPRFDAAGPIGAGTEIHIFDTGLASPGDSEHPGNGGRLVTADAETIDATVPPDGIADIYSRGHGVAIAGIIATVAPGAGVQHGRITDRNGVATDVSAARRMAISLRAGQWPDLMVNAFGSPACDLDPTLPGPELVPLGLQAVAEAVDRHDGTLIVASAGNRSTARPFYPAAFPSVLAVGALDATVDADGNAWTSASRTGPAADFSNLGFWVDAWAPGVALATTHVDGFRFDVDGELIEGRAEVDGTSFSAPLVASLIAEQMTDAKQSPEQAWTVISGTGVKCSAALGGGIAVALTAMDASAATAPAAGTRSVC